MKIEKFDPKEFYEKVINRIRGQGANAKSFLGKIDINDYKILTPLIGLGVILTLASSCDKHKNSQKSDYEQPKAVIEQQAPGTIVDKIEQHYKAGEYELVIKEVDELVEKKMAAEVDTWSELYTLKGKSYQHKGEIGKAELAYFQAFDYNPHSPDYFLQMVHCYETMRNGKPYSATTAQLDSLDTGLVELLDDTDLYDSMKWYILAMQYKEMVLSDPAYKGQLPDTQNVYIIRVGKNLERARSCFDDEAKEFAKKGYTKNPNEEFGIDLSREIGWLRDLQAARPQ